MNRSQQLKTIAWWEFKRFFKWKQELISIALLAIIFLVSAGWGVITEVFSEQHQGAIFYQNKAEQSWRFEAPDDVPLRAAGSMEVQQWQQQLPDDLDVLVVISPSLEAELVVREKDDWQDGLVKALEQQLQQQRIKQLTLSDQQRQVINEPPAITTTVQSTEVSAQDEDEGGFSEALPMLVTVAITVGVFTGFGLMMMSITAEKQQRVTEQLLTIISPTQWMDGKILGITLHSIKSMVFLGLFFTGIGLVASMFSGGDSSVSFDRYYGAVLSVVFVLLGLVLINAMLAGFSATIDDPNHSSRSSVMLLPLLPVFLSFSIIDNPDGGLAQVMSILPISSFVMMPVRLLQTDVTWWQQLLSLALLVVFVIWMRNVAGRLFAMGIQFYGKEPSWKDIWNAIKG
ncbi:ABC transporter permease [Idiomarina sp. OT37-5b]|jgi:ABC-2 type transport system permease protein|uniref:ABC transporter permease n=1 Tax=Idiomarina sp. OT37-5b TaxID=2100422 RepID=UPI000CF8C890|nr:ABC transporter permease [Idiomarina sp. OT37-5b]AVJ55004.1 ABC transporter permease [Idiomarina sp. OT37-5b]